MSTAPNERNAPCGARFETTQTNAGGLHNQYSRKDVKAHKRLDVQADPRHAFADELRAHGFIIDDVEDDGSIHRVRVEGDRAGQQSGWYALHVDGVPAGAFGNWKTRQHERWCSGARNRLTPAERVRMDADIAKAKREREAQRLELTLITQAKARELWAQAAPPTAHAYLTTKGVNAYGIRQLDRLLLIPLRDADSVLWNVQTITPAGRKRFLSGGRKRGLYHAIGSAVQDVLCLAEGYATAASVHVATGHPVAVAFDCGNLEPVAKVLRAKYPHAIITICADNDTQTTGNPGLTAARAAAAAIGGNVATPPEPYNDFNDAARGSAA